MSPDSPLFKQNLFFSSGRLDEGRIVAEYLLDLFPDDAPIRVLDLGAGNGGVTIGLANHHRIRAYALDVIPTIELRDVVAISRLQVPLLSGNGERLPFGDETLHAVACLETIEHVPEPRSMCAEIMRVLRPGGVCVVTTPARARYLFRRDPHAAIPFLVWLPARLQRIVAERIMARTPLYDVHRLYWHVDEIAKLFPGHGNVETRWNVAWPERGGLWYRLWHRFRYFLWDRVMVHKPARK